MAARVETHITNYSREQSPSKKMTTRAMVLGETRIPLPDGNAAPSSSFVVTTHATRRSLRHSISGLQCWNLKHFQVIEVIAANDVAVASWSHTQLTQHLTQLLNDVIECHSDDRVELKLTTIATDRDGQRHSVEITFELISEDTLSRNVQSVFNVIVRVVNKIVTTPDVTNVHYQGYRDVVIRHEALQGHFMKISGDGTVTMEQNQRHVLRCHRFLGHNEKHVCTRSGAGGSCDVGYYPIVVILQDMGTGRVVELNTLSKRLLSSKDERKVDVDMDHLNKADGRFFILDTSIIGSESFCIRPLVLTDFFLRYDAVEGLYLKKCQVAPYLDPPNARFYTFEFFPSSI